MLKISLLNFFLGGLPETFLSVLGIYSLSKNEIPKKIYFYSSLLQAILIYLARMLPINFGVHTILNIIFLILLSTFIIKIPIIKAIAYALIVFVLLSLSEAINLLILINLFNIDIVSVFSNPVSKSLYGVPYLIIYGCSILLIRKIRHIREKTGKINC
jgi:hypothetical protein